MTALHRIAIDPDATCQGDAALAAIQTVYPSAILAGGYLRDARFGKAQKDIDIFVGPDAGLEGLEKALGPDWFVDLEFDVASMDRNEYGKGFGDKVVAAYKAEHQVLAAHFLPVQIIVRHEQPTIEGLMDDFDWSFCQVARATPFYVHAYATPAFALSDGPSRPVFNLLDPDDARMDHSITRGVRLGLKYPERTFYRPLKTYKKSCVEALEEDPFSL